MMRKTIGWIITLTLLAVLTAGCTSQFQEYYPLHISNQWTYRVEDFNGRISENVERIIKRTGDTYHFNNKEIILRLPGQGLVNKQGVIILREPIKLGEKWIESQMTFEITALNKEVIVPAGTFNETIEVTWTSQFPGEALIKPGVMPTLEPGPNPRVFIYIITYAKNVGKIKEEYHAIQPDGTKSREFLSELSSYTLR